MTNLTEFLKQIKECNDIINKDLSGMEARFLPSWQVRKTQSAEAVVKFREGYSSEIDNVAHLVFVSGAEDRTKRFGELAETHADGVVVDFNEVVDELTNSSNLTFTKRTSSTPDEISTLNLVLNGIKTRIGQFPSELINDATLITGIVTKEEQRNLVLRFLQLNTNTQFWINYIRHQYQEKAFKNSFDKTVLPVIITSFPTQLAEEIIASKQFKQAYSLNLKNKVVDKVLLFSTFKQIKEKLVVAKLTQEETQGN